MIPGTLFRLAAISALIAVALPAHAQSIPSPQPRPASLGATPVSQPTAPSAIAPPAMAAPALDAPQQTTPAELAAPTPAASPSAEAAEAAAMMQQSAPTDPGAPLDLTQPQNLPTPSPVPSPVPGTPPGAVLAAASPVDTPAEKQTLHRVNTYFNGITTLVGNFVQIGPDGSRADGKFFLRKPGKVRFYYQQPSTTDIIADGKSLVVRDRKLATQDVYPLSQTPLKFLLDKNLDLARDSKVVGVYEEPGIVSVAIEEETTFGGKARVLIVFASEDQVNYELKQWTITDPQGLDTTIAVSQLDTASKPDDKLFAVDYTRDITRR